MSSPSTGSLPRILTIATNAFREAVRDRVLYNLIVFVLLITVSAVFLSELSGGHAGRVITNLGLTAILFIGTFIAIFVGVSLVWKEIEKRTVFSIFAKPVGRTEFLVGRYLGLAATLFVNIAVMGAGLSLALLFVGDRPLAAAIWPAILLIFLELSVTTAVAILFSSFSTPALSAMLTFLIFVIGHFSSTIKELAGALASPAAKAIVEAIYYGLPNYSVFSFITETSNYMLPTGRMMAGAVAYAFGLTAVVLSIASIVFSRRDMK